MKTSVLRRTLYITMKHCASDNSPHRFLCRSGVRCFWETAHRLGARTSLQLQQAGGFCAEGAPLISKKQELIVLVVSVVSALLDEAETVTAGI